MEKPKIFISWSKSNSGAVAEELKGLLSQVYNEFDYFLSREDIPSGSVWFQEIANHLKNSTAGIICVTPENLNSPWLNFEAGALFNSETQRVHIFLFGLTVQDIKNSPLSQIQVTKFEKQDVLDMLKWINRELLDAGSSLQDHVLEKRFESYWSEFESNLSPKLESFKKKIGWIFSRSELDVSEETKLLQEKGYTFLNSLIFSEEAKPSLEEYDLLIFRHDDSLEDHETLRSVIHYLKNAYDSKIPIILYIESRLPQEIYKECTSYPRFDTANSPSRIVDYCEKYLQ